MIRYVTLFIYIVLTDYVWAWLPFYLVTHAAYTYYFYEMELSFPYVGMIPGIRALYYRRLSGRNLAVVIMYLLMSVSVFLLPMFALDVLWLIFYVWMEIDFARVNTDCNPILFALVPPFKVYYLYKEARSLKN